MTIKYIKEEAAWLADFYHSAGSNILLKVKTRLNKSNMCVAIVKLRDSDGNVNVEKYYSFSTLSNVKNEMLDYFITNIKNGIDEKFVSYFPISRGTQVDSHTEIQLLNYLFFLGLFGAIDSLIFISTRPICQTCINGMRGANIPFPIYGFDLGGNNDGITNYVSRSSYQEEYDYTRTDKDDNKEVELVNILANN